MHTIAFVKYKYVLLALALAIAAIGQAPETLTQPQTLADQIRAGSAPKVVYVGFPILYKGAHVPQALFAGPCSKPEGLALLSKEVKDLSRNTQLVLYCGCCPFVRCPNVHPAYKALAEMGFTNVKILQLETNFHTDWVEKGYPTEK